MLFPVLRHHALQAELVGALIGYWDANQAAAVCRHEINRFRRHFLGTHDEIAFVLAIGIVGDNDHAPFRNVAQNIVNRVELKCVLRPGNH